MEIQNQIKLNFIGVDFPIVNFNSENYIRENPEIEIDIKPKVFYQKGTNHFKIIQEVTVKSENFFSLFLVAFGHFELIGKVEDETKKNFVNVNAPAIMFPYIRSFISTLTSNIGNLTGTLTIPAQFFKGELEEITEEELQNKKA